MTSQGIIATRHTDLTLISKRFKDWKVNGYAEASLINDRV